MENYLQYGAMGLLAVVIGGFFWYVRSVENRQAAREASERQERGDVKTRRDARDVYDREEREKQLGSLLAIMHIIVDIQKEISTMREANSNQHHAINRKLDQIGEAINKFEK